MQDNISSNNNKTGQRHYYHYCIIGQNFAPRKLYNVNRITVSHEINS